jgi:acetyl-CoA carboxylase carboxyltransferase component
VVSPSTPAASRGSGPVPPSPSARARIDALIDPGSFTEYGALAEDPGHPGAAPADGLVTGLATIDGRPAAVASFDVTVLGGTQSPLNARKLEKLIYLAREHRWALVIFADGAGRRPASLADPLTLAYRFGLFDGLAELSGLVPTVAVIGRAADAENAALALCCELVVAVDGAAIDTDAAGDRAASGDIDLMAPDEEAAADLVYEYLSLIGGDQPGGVPAADAAAIGSIVPASRRRAYDMTRVLAAFADADTLLELRPDYGKALVTALARLDGRAIGVYANQPFSATAGALGADECDKLSRFVELCDAHGLPLVSFADVPGFMVGPDAERAGLARHHFRPLQALHHRRVPLCAVQVRKAYGLGAFAMTGYGYSRLIPDLRLAWPTTEGYGGIAPEGAAYLMRRAEIAAAESPEAAREIVDQYAEKLREHNAGEHAGRTCYADDVIDPAATRDRVSAVLRLVPRVPPPDGKRHYIDPVLPAPCYQPRVTSPVLPAPCYQQSVTSSLQVKEDRHGVHAAGRGAHRQRDLPARPRPLPGQGRAPRRRPGLDVHREPAALAADRGRPGRARCRAPADGRPVPRQLDRLHPGVAGRRARRLRRRPGEHRLQGPLPRPRAARRRRARTGHRGRVRRPAAAGPRRVARPGHHRGARRRRSARGGHQAAERDLVRRTEQP